MASRGIPRRSGRLRETVLLREDRSRLAHRAFRKELSDPGVVAEWLKAAVLKGDPPLSHSIRLSPPPSCSVCRRSQAESVSVRGGPPRGAESPHKVPHTHPRARGSERQQSPDDAAADLVRAIRRAHRSPIEGDDMNGGVVMFTVRDVFAFARRLVEQGVTVTGGAER
jgi:hypothetical protein